MIKFNPRYKEDILNGNKKITIRKGIFNNIFPGTIIETNLGFSLKIISVFYGVFADIPKADLEDDGFYNLDNCLDTLRKFYKEIEVLDLCTVIRFKKKGGLT